MSSRPLVRGSIVRIPLSESASSLASFFTADRIQKCIQPISSIEDKTEEDPSMVSVGMIVLSDESKLNALTEAMGRQFTETVQTMRDLAKRGLIRACIVTGDGEAFSAGIS